MATVEEHAVTVWPSQGLMYRTGDLPVTKGKALLVSTAFPPSAEAGSARWEGFAPFLSASGWALDVVMEHPETLPLVDPKRCEGLPDGLRVVGVPRRIPSWFRSIVRFNQMLRPAGTAPASVTDSTVAAPRTAARKDTGFRSQLITQANAQRDRRWIANAAAAGRRLLDAEHRVVISSGPPHSAHVAAHRLARAAGLPHVVDLRDPWAPLAELTDVTHFDVSVRYESATLRAARLIIANTGLMRDDLARRFPDLQDRIVAIPNGSDLVPLPVPPFVAGEPFVIAHAGALYLDRDPRPLLRAIARLSSEGLIAPDNFRTVFMGGNPVVAGKSLDEWGREYGLGTLLEVRERGTRDEARQLLRSAAVAVAFQGQTTSQIPAKVYEYVSFPAWLLALVGTSSATASLLSGSEALVLAIDDEAGIAAALRTCIAQFRQSGRPAPAGADGRFGRNVQAARLIELLNAL